MEQNQDLAKIKAVFKRRRWWLAGSFVALLLLTVVLCLILPNRYLSTTAILIESQQIPPSIVPSTVTSFAEQRIQSITQEAMSRSRLLKLVDRYNLLPQKREKMTTEDLIDEIRERITITPINAEINKETQNRPVLLTIAFTLSYEDEEPKRAQSVANEIASYYMEANLQSREKNAQGTTNFLQEQLAQVKAEIDELEAKIAVYREAHLEELPEFTIFNLQRVEKLKMEIGNLNSQIRSMEEQSSILSTRLSLTDAWQETGEQRVVSPSERLQQMEMERAQLLSKYSENHPLILAKNREISLVEERSGRGGGSGTKGERLKELKLKLTDLKSRYSDEHPAVKNAVRELSQLESTSGQSRSWRPKADGGKKRSNPAYVTFKADLEKIAVSISSAKAERARLEKELEEINAKLQTGPRVAKEYNELTSDYQVSKNHYNEIKQKLMAAQLAQGMEEDQLGETFRVVEPAFLPEKPSKPNRLVIMLVGLVLALGFSMGTAFAREYTDKKVQDGETVEAVTGMPLLSIIPHFVSLEDQFRIRNRRLALAALALVGVVGAVAAFHLLVMDLHIFYAKAARLLQTKMPI